MNKRIFDLAVSLVTLVTLSPVFLVIFFLVRLKLGKPVFFRQKRPGLNGEIFELIKFRTMTDLCNAEGNLLPDSQRLTGFGKWLRNSSLDELPEIINVIRGDMSLVGPRPLLVEYLKLYSREQARRHSVRPGVTGWAQVNGRNSITWEQKFAFDIWYVRNHNLLLDIKILLMTIWKTLRRSDISQKDNATMTKFTGN